MFKTVRFLNLSQQVSLVIEPRGDSSVGKLQQLIGQVHVLGLFAMNGPRAHANRSDRCLFFFIR